ncbi:CLUMA_CG007308, isoform A [Clunio marinus]|uniref:CLUMA_CG007308, isoform A n=1 Tax=Clunio marinus TaxID=568069 RepID=A0A1J1I0I3_9DIPT|nr:CLUMA_CG007308, isoform A [Clunio marinus]
MYAAAGGASCRNARKRQAQQHIKDKAAQAKALKEKLDAAKAAELAAPTKSKQFHQLPASYLRAPHASNRKLSAGYTGHSSKLLLPISEQSAQHHSPSQQTLLHHSRHHFHYTNEPRTPTLRLDVDHHQKLTKSATASFPLVSQAGTPPASPSICFRQQQHFFKESQNNLLSAQHPIHIQIPVINDGIIITPATPLPSPSPSQKQQIENEKLGTEVVERIAPKFDDLPEFPLERACSVYRNRKLEASETKIKNNVEIDDQQHQQQFYPGGMPNGNSGLQTHWADEFCDSENQALGVCTCDHIEAALMLRSKQRIARNKLRRQRLGIRGELPTSVATKNIPPYPRFPPESWCAQGRAAWLERGRRCSVQDPNTASYHRRWVKRNRIQDSSIGGSSDDEDLLGVIRGPSTFANAFLYIGLGTISLGSIIFFVGTGEKGFKTQELRLIGPALAGIGVIFCILRIFFCVCPSHCISNRERNKKDAKSDADHRTSLLHDTKRVSIARGPYINSKIPMSSSQSSQFPPKSIVKNKSYEGVETLRQIASTSLFLDNEQKVNGQTIPTINEPEEEPPIELKKMETLKVDTLNIIDIISTDEESDHLEPLFMETSLMAIEPSPLSPPPFSPPPALPLTPNTNIVTTSFNREVGFLSLPLTSTTTDEAGPSERRKHHHRHKHHHKHRHSTAVGRTAPIDDRGQSTSSGHQPPETEIVLSPSKLGQ